MKQLSIFLVLMCFTSNDVLAADISTTIDGLTYTVKSGNDYAEVKAASSTITEANILGSVTIDGVEYLVTTIANQAFKNCSSLSSINFPESITTILYEAFRGCTELTSVRIPDQVTKFSGYYTFAECTSLSDVDLNNVTELHGWDFDGCINLKSVDISKVTDFGGEQAFARTGLISVTIPEGVTDIGYCTFEHCLSLESIVLPEGITVIKAYYLNECVNLRSIVIPSTVEYIESYAFDLCLNLESIVFKNPNVKFQDYYSGSGGTGYSAAECVFLGCNNATVVIVNDESSDFMEKANLLKADIETNPYQHSVEMDEELIEQFQSIYEQYPDKSIGEIAEIILDLYEAPSDERLFLRAYAISVLNYISGESLNPSNFLFTPYDIQISNAGVSTLYLPYDAQIPDADYFAAYYVSNIDEEGELYLRKLENVIPALTPVVIFGNKGTYPLYYGGEVAGVEGNWLKGVCMPKTVSELMSETGEDIYVLSRGTGNEASYINFYKAEPEGKVTTIPAYKGYLPYTALGSSAKSLGVKFDEIETTGIETLNVVPETQSGSLYDLQGRCITVDSILPKGFYIMNGRKVFIR